MTETPIRIYAARSEEYALPQLNEQQQCVLERAKTSHVVVRGAPASGRTTCAIALIESISRAQETSESHGSVSVSSNYSTNPDTVLLLVPDRLRATHLTPQVQTLLPDAVRPVRTPAALAYHIVNTWRVERNDPLGDLELMTGARTDQRLEEMLAQIDAPWPSHVTPQLRELPHFRADLRNLFARVGEAALSPKELNDLGQKYGYDEWVAAARLLKEWEESDGFSVHTRGVMNADVSRLQHIAGMLLRHWHEWAPQYGVFAEPPIPAVIVIDDLQDCTPSTVELLCAAASLGSRIVAFSDPDVAIATYRGGEPQLDGRLAQALGVDIMELGPVYLGNAPLRDLVRRVVSRIGQSGPFGRRMVECVQADTPEETCELQEKTDDEDSGISLHIHGSGPQLGAAISRLLRQHYLHDGIAWGQQVVIVKSTAQVEEWHRYLRRAGIPIKNTRQAFTFSAEPAARTLLDVIVNAYGDDEEQWVEALLDSPFIGTDSLDLNRALRWLNRQMNISEMTGDCEQENQHTYTITDLVGNPDLLSSTLVDPEVESPFSVLSEQMTRAHAVWKLRGKLGDMNPSAALWSVWEATGVAQQWQEYALRNDSDSVYYDDQLDVVLALFRVADTWEKHYPHSSAADFAEQILMQTLPVDTLTNVGIRPEGVEVLTPAQSVGRHWEVVCICGLEEGTWPDLRLRNRILHAELLAYITQGTYDTADDAHVLHQGHVHVARRSLLDDERRLFALALSRSTHFIHCGAVQQENSAPSQFLDVFTSSESKGNEEEEIMWVQQTPPPLDFTGHVGRLRHRATQETSSVEREYATQLLGELASCHLWRADPQYWTGSGGVTSDDPVYTGHKIRISPSNFEKARQCSAKWFLEKYAAEPAIGSAQALGTLIHAIAQENPHGTDEELQSAFEKRAGELELDENTGSGRKAKIHAEKVVQALGEYLATVPGKVDVEIPVELPLGNAVIKGKIDRIEYVDEGIRITDLKTGKGGNKRKPADASDNPQLALYQLALRAQGHNVTSARLVFFGNEDVRYAHQLGLDEETTQQWEEEIHAVSESMRGPYYAATPSEENCRYCSYAHMCPANDEGKRTIE
ncbi:PD-(D/E)XK nuclease family protein [Schaalia sp. lx-100]|uniref:PD-(D/E)XK nuclease family protein n=1 Tax=Schaalia sp. lx-100 TaxID=2899081 RepID=UPI001E3D7C25|nr:PD-(D/E)XK nuclease family protein [Schaalia sp. lx-100]MCD4557277.1 PD-(D/E)XK nuclease family protein [Schaalia sp. lx-100]